MSRKKTQNKTNIILNRISEHYHLTNDDDIASFYNVSASTVSSWRTRDSINERLIRAKCDDENLANWFINGIKTQDGIHDRVADQQTPYNAHPSAPKISLDLLRKIAAVLESQGNLSEALKLNIEAFHHALLADEKLKQANERIDILEERMKLLEARLPAIVNGL